MAWCFVLSKKVVNSLLVLVEDCLYMYPQENFISRTMTSGNEGNLVGGFVGFFFRYADK